MCTLWRNWFRFRTSQHTLTGNLHGLRRNNHYFVTGIMLHKTTFVAFGTLVSNVRIRSFVSSAQSAAQRPMLSEQRGLYQILAAGCDSVSASASNSGSCTPIACVQSQLYASFMYIVKRGCPLYSYSHTVRTVTFVIRFTLKVARNFSLPATAMSLTQARSKTRSCNSSESASLSEWPEEAAYSKRLPHE